MDAPIPDNREDSKNHSLIIHRPSSSTAKMNDWSRERENWFRFHRVSMVGGHPVESGRLPSYVPIYSISLLPPMGIFDTLASPCAVREHSARFGS